MRAFSFFSVLWAYFLTASVVARIIITGCSMRRIEQIDKVIRNEIPTLLSRASVRLTGYLADLRESQNNNFDAMTDGVYVVHRLLGALIDGKNGEDVSLDVQRRIAYVETINKTLTVVRENTQENLRTNRNWQITCGPDWISRDFNGVLRDERVRVAPADRNRTITVPGGLRYLDAFNQANRAVMLIFNGLAGPYSSVTVLNQNNFGPYMVSVWPPGSFFGVEQPRLAWYKRGYDFLGRMFPSDNWVHPGLLNLDELVPHHLSSVLLWALFQTTTMVNDTAQGTSVLGDRTCSFDNHPAFHLVQGRGWTCISDLAKSDPGRAMKNPTNLQYLIVALFFQNFDFSLGVNRGKSFVNTRYQIGKRYPDLPWLFPNIPRMDPDIGQRSRAGYRGRGRGGRRGASRGGRRGTIVGRINGPTNVFAHWPPPGQGGAVQQAPPQLPSLNVLPHAPSGQGSPRQGPYSHRQLPWVPGMSPASPPTSNQRVTGPQLAPINMPDAESSDQARPQHTVSQLPSIAQLTGGAPQGGDGSQGNLQQPESHFQDPGPAGQNGAEPSDGGQANLQQPESSVQDPSPAGQHDAEPSQSSG